MAFNVFEEQGSDIGFMRTLFILLVVGMLLFGCVMIYSASAPSAVAEGSHPAVYLLDQLKFALIGIVAAVGAWCIPYRVWLGRAANAVWFLGMALVVLTMFSGAGGDTWGAQRWLVLGPISLQSSEFMKIAIAIVAAKIMSEYHSGILEFKEAIGKAFVLVGVPMLLILETQSDLGTTMIIFAAVIVVMWLGEVPTTIVVGLIVAAAGLAVLATVFSSYRSSRFLYLDPWNDGKGGYGAGYQIIHSYYAFSQGGLFGVGIGNSTEKYLYLPESETDFIYSVIGEELGMFGALAVLVAFIVLGYAGLRIAYAAEDDFGCMLAGSLTVMLVVQAFLNMGSAAGLLPTTGKPLPFISSGGSSLIATFIMVGLVLSVSQGSTSFSLPFGRGKKGDVYEQRRDNLRVIHVDGAGGSGHRAGGSSRRTSFLDESSMSGGFGGTSSSSRSSRRTRNTRR